MSNEKQPAIADPLQLLVQGCERPWEVAVEPFRVSPHVYYVGNSWVGAYLIATLEGLILIDTTMHGQVYLLFESIRKLGYDPRDIKMILLSHAHYDHCGGLRPIAEYSKAKIYMGKEDAFFLTDRTDLLFTEGYPFGNFKADSYFADDTPITLGGMTIRTRHTPGHTPGTTSFFFDDVDSDGAVYCCGLHGGIGLNTLDFAFLDKKGLPREMRTLYIKGLESLRGEKIDIALGSHPNQTRMLEKKRSITDFKPFVDEREWPRLMDERLGMIREMEKKGL
ncbi:MAG: MBL fold metallo-hydrolase [Treponemataceae bacterium]